MTFRPPQRWWMSLLMWKYVVWSFSCGQECSHLDPVRVLSLAEEERKVCLSQQTPFCFTALVIFFSPTFLLEKELTAVQINQRDLINLAPAHTSNLETRQAINSANYLLLEGWG